MFGIKKYIPNFITSLNIAAGSLSIMFSFEGYITLAAYLILIAAVFDFLDGMMARLLNAYSEMGKQLDSLADLISFGVAPSIIVYHIMKDNLLIESLDLGSIGALNLIFLFSFVLIPIFSALRLAKFNIDENQANSFVGLPTPSNAIFFAAIPIIFSFNHLDPFVFFIYNKTTLLGIIVVSSLLLVSPLPMFSFKFKHLRFRENEIKYIFLALILIILIKTGMNRSDSIISLFLEFRIIELFKQFFYILTKALPIIIFLYIFLSIINAKITKLKSKKN